MQDFLKGGSVATLCAKFLRSRPLSIKTTPIFERLGEKLLVLQSARRGSDSLVFFTTARPRPIMMSLLVVS